MVTHGDILSVLRTIDDPEMPISIVDLGIVEKVELRQESGVSSRESGVRSQKSAVGAQRPESTGPQAHKPEAPAKETRQPETPARVREQGSAGEGMRVSVVILPTFVGCPALPVIENEIQRRVGALPGVAAVDVHVTYAPAWSVDRITQAGRESLRRHGVTVPQAGEENAGQAPACPFCGSAAVRQESAFGPTRCRTIWYCESCRHPFEHLKRLSTPGLIALSLDRLGRPG